MSIIACFFLPIDTDHMLIISVTKVAKKASIHYHYHIKPVWTVSSLVKSKYGLEPSFQFSTLHQV